MAPASAQQFDLEGRAARRVGLQRARRRRGHAPARRGGARHRFGGDTQAEHGDARRFGGKHQPPRRGQIEPGCTAPGFDQQRAKPGAARGIGGGAQQRGFVGDQHQQQRRRIEPKFGETGRVQAPALAFARLGPQPQQRHCFPGQRTGDGETGAAGTVVGFEREHFVQLRGGEPLGQPCIDGTRITLARHRGGGKIAQPSDQGRRVVHNCSCNVLLGESPSGKSLHLGVAVSGRSG